MSYPFALPENTKIVDGWCANVGAGAAITGDYVSLKGYHKAYVVIKYRQADANAITWNVTRATNVSAGSAAVMTELMRIWSNLDTATSDLLVERTAAVNYASGGGATNKIIIFEVDPDSLTDTFDCIAGCSTTVIAAAQYVDITYYLIPKYPGRVLTSPSAIID
jgi:hypothetical protein